MPVHVREKIARRSEEAFFTELRIGVRDAGAYVGGEIPVYRAHDIGEKLTVGESLWNRNLGANIAVLEILEELGLELRLRFIATASSHRKQMANLSILTRAHMQRESGYRKPHVFRSKQQGIGAKVVHLVDCPFNQLPHESGELLDFSIRERAVARPWKFPWPAGGFCELHRS